MEQEPHGLTVEEIPRASVANPRRISLRDARRPNPLIDAAVDRIVAPTAPTLVVAAFQSSI